jgi:hypothetical protein
MLRAHEISVPLLAIIGMGWMGLGAGEACKENLDLPIHGRGDGDKEEEDEIAPYIFVFYGQQFEGDAIFFSCDRSGTMKKGLKWPTLQRELIQSITGFSRGVQFGIAFFDAGLSKFPPSGRPAEATQATKAAATAYVRSLSPGGGTCCRNGLFTAIEFAQQAVAKRKLIIHLADGITTCPGHNPETYRRETLIQVRQRNVERIPINTICIGPVGGVNESWMQELAYSNGGSYSRIVTE